MIIVVKVMVIEIMIALSMAPPFILGWNSPRADPILESYFSLLEREAMSIAPQGGNFSNLSIGE